MDPITQKLVPGASGFIPNHYVDEVFSVDTWFGTGTGANTPANKKITNGINMQKHGGMVLNFQRGDLSGNFGGDCHKTISDTDIGPGKRFYPTSGNNQLGTQADAMQSFDSDGWTMGVNVFMNEGQGDGSNSSQNGAFTFRKQPGFFDMVTFTTSTSRDNYRRINHSLKCKPGFWILKNQSSAGDFYVYHKGKGKDWIATLNETNDFSQDNSVWGYTDPTTTDFGVNESAPWWSADSTYTVYLWADGDDPDAKIFGMGKDSEIVKAVIGGGQSTLTDVGWEPQMLLIKNAGSDWCWIDNVRGTAATTEMNMYDPGYKAAVTFTNNNQGESTGYEVGFNIKGWFQSTFGGDCYCLAIRRPDAKVGKWASSPQECTHLHKGTTVSSERLYLGNATGGGLGGGAFGTFDMMFNMRQWGNISYQPRLQNTNRLMSGSSNQEGGAGTSNVQGGFSRWYLEMNNYYVQANTVATERDVRYDITDSDAYIPWDGFMNNSGTVGDDHIFYMFKRKPGFFDMWKYHGRQQFVEPYTTHTPHQLGVPPDLVIVKSLGDNSFNNADAYVNGWIVWSRAAGVTGIHDARYNTCYINNGPVGTRYQLWGDNINDALTAETIRITAQGIINQTGCTGHLMYMFANREGIFHTGIYTGAGLGTPVDVTEVGFSPRILMIKCVTDSGPWWVYDTKRGLSSDNDPYINWVSPSVWATNTDYVDPLSNGFQITATAPEGGNAMNNSGEKFLYIAFA